MKKTLLLSTMSLAVATLFAVTPSSLRVYINPGHGGHDSDDRGVTVYPYAAGDTAGYWESNSNLYKGFAFRQILWDSWPGINVKMSRVTNTTADDLPLGTIGRAANAYGADFFLSIHSNATGTVNRVNFPLMLYRGWDEGKGAAIGEADEAVPGSLKIAKILGPILYSNKATVWTSNYQVRGDWSFYSSWSYKSGLGVLRQLTVPGMLSEGSFHDYIPELYRLLNTDFCWQEGWHFTKAVEQYFNFADSDKPKVGHISGLLIDDRAVRDQHGQNFKIFGSDNNEPITNCKVELLNEDKSQVLQTYTTDALFNGFYIFKNLQPGKYYVRTSIPTHFDTETLVEVKANEVTYNNLQLKKQRLTPPEVLSYSPVWKAGDEPILCNTPLVFNFNWDMDPSTTEKALKIEPETKGTFTWEDLNFRMVFNPDEPYATSTHYKVTLETTAEHAGGMKLQNPLTFEFETNDRNYMEIIGQSLKDGGEIHYKNAAIEFRFDKLPNISPILKQVSVVDSKGEAVKLNNRGLTYSKTGSSYGFFRLPFLNDLTVGENYTLTMSPEVSDKDGITLQSGLTIHFKAVDAGESKTETTLEDFEDVTLYTVTDEGSVNLASQKVSANKSKQLFGTSCASFTYNFTDFSAGEVLWNRVATEKGATSENKLGVHVNGDLSGNELYIQMSSDIDIKYALVCELDFLGWKYIEVPLTVLEGTNTYKITGVKIVQTESQMGKSGEVMLDNINLIGEDGVDAVKADVADFAIYPNPASEYLIANAVVWIEDMELVSLSGATVSRVQGNVMNVSEIPSGTYIVRVNVSGKNVSQKVVIKH